MSDTTDAAARKPGPYDTVTIRDVFAWLDRLRGWDIATHVEYEALRDVALRQLDEAEADARALDAARVAAEARADAEHARAGQWKRLAEGWEDDFREQMQGQHHEFVEKTIQQMRNEHLHPDDLDAEPGDTEGEAQP